MILERALHFSTSQVFLERKKLATCRENAIISFIVFNIRYHEWTKNINDISNSLS